MPTTIDQSWYRPGERMLVPPLRVLFVDDEPHLLAGLRRMLHPQRHRWDVLFAESGPAALELMRQRRVAAVVTDMRMPGMDGAQLLAQVQRLYPSTARIVLSGQADRASVLAVLRTAQQFLAKPCDVPTLTGCVERALAVRRLLAEPRLRELIGGVSSLPTLPAVYHELVDEMDVPEPDLGRIGRLLASDVATCTDLLKLVNSAFFGLPREVNSAEAAVSLLGLDNIRALMLAGSIFRASYSPGRTAQIEELRALALRRTALARVIADHEGWPDHERTLIVLAAMLRDVGDLVLAEGLPASAVRIIEDQARSEGPADPARRARLEREAYGCTVPQASAYLLGLWGFAPAVVHTVAGHALIDGVLEGASEAGRFERLLDFAHRRALDPAGPAVPEGEHDYLDARRLAAWNRYADEMVEPPARRPDDRAPGR
jgi:HD-like signal output (HDOD) protein/ActR/RegA family two-component response regulator